MALNLVKKSSAYGLNNGPGTRGGNNYLAPIPLTIERAPTTNDKAQAGQIVIFNNVPYMNIDGGGTWLALGVAGGGGVFTSLTVTPGPISLTGTTSINTSGSAATSIGVGGTGAVNIGNATGGTNIVAGDLTIDTGEFNVDAGSITVSVGNIEATAGEITAGILLQTIDGNLQLGTAGNKISIPTGANASIGTATLVAGTVTVATTAVTGSSLIFISRETAGGTLGHLSLDNIVAGTSFDIISDEAADTSTVNWWIIN